MPTKKKRLTQREKAERAKMKKEQIGVFKTLKIAIELDKFLRRLEADGRKQYTIGELFDEVFFPVWKL